MPEGLRILITVGNEAEAQMICEWLAEARIRSLPRIASGGVRLGAAAAREVYVAAEDHARALQVVNAEVPTDAELAALSEAAATQQSRPARGEPVEIPVPTRSEFLAALELAAATAPHGASRPSAAPRHPR